MRPSMWRSTRLTQRGLHMTAGVVLVAGSWLLVVASADAATPTCADVLGVEVHGQHIVGDYVTGSGHDTLDWPPSGTVGTAITRSGAVVPGGPGPGFHFPNDVAPGASFCNAQAQSPGFHVP